MTSFTRVREALGDRVVHASADHLKARCPAHDDSTPSLEVTHRADRTLIKCHAGCSVSAITAALQLTARDLFDTPSMNPTTSSRGRRLIKAYDYVDAAGRLLFQKVRYEPKGFSLRRPDGNDGWIYNRQGVHAVLYRLPAVQRAISEGATVYVVEGEKDVETLESLGLVATCNADGAAKEGQSPKWGKREAQQLLGATCVVVIPDNDDAGVAHGQAIVRSLHALPNAPEVRVVMLPNLEPKGDVTDWVCLGGTREQLEALVNATSIATPTSTRSTPSAKRRDDSEDDASLGPDITEDGLALQYTEETSNELKYCSTLGGWQAYDGVCWNRDLKRRSYSKSRELVRRIAQHTSLSAKQYTRLRSSATVNAVVSLASSDPRHTVTQDQFDRDPWCLNTPDGIVDLRSGAMRPRQADDLCTKATTAAPNGEAPRWMQFLHEVTGGDQEVMAYLQRFAGYCLTGETREHALVFVYGTGGNGKSVFLNTLLEMVGTYGMQAPMSIFEEKANESHPTELAMLRGARLVVATETEEGRRWAESRIKVMTGGDPITARFMRGDFFTYQPQFKPVIAGNHRPGFRNPDEAIQRRLHLVPFTQTFPAPDRELSARLKAEAGGILRWAIAGCLQWQVRGLDAPESVRVATSDYLEEQDVVREWLDECTEDAPGHFTPNPDIWASWQQWASARGVLTRTKHWVTGGLARHGFQSAKMRHGGRQDRGFVGLRVVGSTLTLGLVGHSGQQGDISTSHARAHIPAHAHARAQAGRRYGESVSQVSRVGTGKVLVTWRGGEQVVLDANDRDLTLMRDSIARVEPYPEAA